MNNTKKIKICHLQTEVTVHTAGISGEKSLYNGTKLKGLIMSYDALGLWVKAPCRTKGKSDEYVEFLVPAANVKDIVFLNENESPDAADGNDTL